MVELKLLDTTNAWQDMIIDIEECKEKCLNNYSCMNYTYSNIRDGNGYAMWFGDPIDIREIIVSGQDLYIQMPALELGS